MTPSNRNVRRIVLGALAVFILLPVLAFLVWRLGLAHDVNSRLAAIRTAGLPTSGAELNRWYAAVPDAENAALVMTQAFALMRNYPDNRSNEVTNFKFPARGQPLTPEQRELLASYVEMNAAAIAKAQDAIKLPKSRYPVDFGLGVGFEVPHLPELKRLCLTLQLKALLALDSADAMSADEAITNILGIARTLDPEPELVSWLVRRAALRMATLTMERRLIFGVGNDSQLAAISAIFTAAEQTNLFARTLIGHRAIAIPLFRMTWADIAKHSDQNDSIASQLPKSDRQPAMFQLTGTFERDLRFYLDSMAGEIALAGLPPPRSFALQGFESKRLEELERHNYIVSKLAYPAVSRGTIMEADQFARLRTARVALAIERFRLANGRLPENLAELTPKFLPAVPIDPFDGAPLKYRRLEKGYVIYSVDRDGHDDGGREKPPDWKSSDTTSYDITFTVER